MSVKKAEIKAVLSLDQSKFVKGIQKAIELGKRLRDQFKKDPVGTAFAAGAVAAEKSIRGIAGVAKFAFKVAAAGAVAFGAALTAISVKAIKAAASVETAQASFKVLLGSASAAQERIKALMDFEQNAPVDFDKIVEASRVLEVLTKGALATGEGFRMVGDVASGTNRDITDMAQSIGHLYAALRSGTSASDALENLMGAGAIDPSAKRKILAMAGIDGSKAWAMAVKELNRFDKQLDEKSATWDGKMHRFHNSIFLALAAFGKPLKDALLPGLDAAAEALKHATPQIAAAGESFAKNIGEGVTLLKDAFENPGAMFETFGAGLKAVLLSALESFGMRASAIISKVIEMMKNPFAPGMAFSSMMASLGANGPMSAEGAWKEYAEKRARHAGAAPEGERDTSKAMTADQRKAAKWGTMLTSGGVKGASLVNHDFSDPFFSAGAKFNYHNPLGDGAKRSVNRLFGVRESRRADQAVRAARIGEGYLKTGKFDMSLADGESARKGDRSAAMAYARDKQREKLGLDKTNAILTSLEGKFDKAWLQKN